MSELRELYQAVILDHNKKPRNFGALDGANHSADGHNPLCGDRIRVQLRIAGDRLEDVHFEGSGCAISMASVSLMTEAVKGRSIGEARRLFDGFHELVTSDPQEPPRAESLGKLTVFSGVREFPMRVKCATLAWHTLRNAIDDDSGVASTE